MNKYEEVLTALGVTSFGVIKLRMEQFQKINKSEAYTAIALLLKFVILADKRLAIIFGNSLPRIRVHPITSQQG